MIYGYLFYNTNHIAKAQTSETAQFGTAATESHFVKPMARISGYTSPQNMLGFDMLLNHLHIVVCRSLCLDFVHDFRTSILSSDVASDTLHTFTVIV